MLKLNGVYNDPFIYIVSVIDPILIVFVLSPNVLPTFIVEPDKFEKFIFKVLDVDWIDEAVIAPVLLTENVGILVPDGITFILFPIKSILFDPQKIQ